MRAGRKEEFCVSRPILCQERSWELSHTLSYFIKVFFPLAQRVDFNKKPGEAKKEIAPWLAGNPQRHQILLKGLIKMGLTEVLLCGLITKSLPVGKTIFKMIYLQ